jgi:hypothetical protein
MSQNVYALRQHIQRLAQENAALRSALVSTNEVLKLAKEEMEILRVPFFQRWRMRRLLAKRRAEALEAARARVDSTRAELGAAIAAAKEEPSRIIQLS